MANAAGVSQETILLTILGARAAGVQIRFAWDMNNKVLLDVFERFYVDSGYKLTELHELFGILPYRMASIGRAQYGTVRNRGRAYRQALRQIVSRELRVSMRAAFDVTSNALLATRTSIELPVVSASAARGVRGMISRVGRTLTKLPLIRRLTRKATV